MTASRIIREADYQNLLRRLDGYQVEILDLREELDDALEQRDVLAAELGEVRR